MICRVTQYLRQQFVEQRVSEAANVSQGLTAIEASLLQESSPGHVLWIKLAAQSNIAFWSVVAQMLRILIHVELVLRHLFWEPISNHLIFGHLLIPALRMPARAACLGCVSD